MAALPRIFNFQIPPEKFYHYFFSFRSKFLGYSKVSKQVKSNLQVSKMDLNFSQAFLAITVPLRESLMHSLRRLLGKEVTVTRTDRPLNKKENCYNKIDAVEENTRTSSLHKHEERTKDKEKMGTVGLTLPHWAYTCRNTKTQPKFQWDGKTSPFKKPRVLFNNGLLVSLKVMLSFSDFLKSTLLTHFLLHLKLLQNV